jgi:hypothetical protein
MVHKGWQSHKHARVKATMYVVHARDEVVVRTMLRVLIDDTVAVQTNQTGSQYTSTC